MLTDADSGPDDRVVLEVKQHEEVLDLSQDILCAAIAKIATPKHVGTAVHIIKQTRSKDTVTLLNRFGNCISYNDAQRHIYPPWQMKLMIR